MFASQGCRRGATFVRSALPSKSLPKPVVVSGTYASCRAIKKAYPKVQSGAQTIKPKKGMAAIKVWCDQETDGGGWTMISQARAAKAAATETLCQAKAIGTLDVSNG